MSKHLIQGGFDNWDSAIIVKRGFMGAGDLSLQIPFIKGRRSYLICTEKTVVQRERSDKLSTVCGVKS